MKGFKQRVSTFKWETVIWKGEKFKTPFLDNDSLYHNQSDIYRFSKIKDDVVQMFVDFCDRHSLKISLVETKDGRYLFTPVLSKDMTAFARNYQAATFAFSTEESIEVWGIGRGFLGYQAEYSMFLYNFDEKTGEESVDWIIAIDFYPLRSLVSRAIACL